MPELDDKIRHAYTAGLIDGEGSLELNYVEGTVWGIVHVVISNQHKPLLETLKTYYGYGGIYRNGAAWKWSVNKAEDIVDILTKTIPYLTIKQQEAIVLIEIARITKRRGRSMMSDQERLLRKRLNEMFNLAKEERFKVLKSA